MLRRFYVLGLLPFIIFACDSNEPADGLSITQAVLTLERIDPDGTFDPRKTQSLRIEGLPNPTTTDTVYVVRGASYEGSIRFFDEDGLDQTMTVRFAPETSEVSYSLTGLNTLSIVATDKESDYGTNDVDDDLPVGLEYAIDVADDATPSEGTLRIQLERFANEQKGSAEPEHVDVDFNLPIRLLRPGAQQPTAPDLITSLSFGFRFSGGSLGFSRENAAGYQIFSEDSLVNAISSGMVSANTLEPFNEAGESLLTKLKNEGAWYQIFYDVEGPAADSVEITVTDNDVDGLPLGLNSSMRIAPGAAGMRFDVRIRMAFYDPQKGRAKDGVTISDELLIDLLLRITLRS